MGCYAKHEIWYLHMTFGVYVYVQYLYCLKLELPSDGYVVVAMRSYFLRFVIIARDLVHCTIANKVYSKKETHYYA